MSHNVGGIDVSRETYDRLIGFSALVQKWTPSINLIAKGSISEIYERHIVDSAQIYQFSPKTMQKWVDLGSGGGFPGIVLAIIAKEKYPDTQFILIESDTRKAVFLRTAIREFGLTAAVIHDRIEQVDEQHADVVSARALAPLPVLLPLVRRHMKNTGTALVHKGKNAADEIKDAQRNWRFLLEDWPSITDPEARLLSIQGIDSRDI